MSKHKDRSIQSSMDELDRLLGVDDSYDLIFGDDDDTKKKKKKKKGKDKDKKKSKSVDTAYGDSLKLLKKKELRKKAEKMGIDLNEVDIDSKKELRKAIMDAMSAASSEKHKKTKTTEVALRETNAKPRHYIDEENDEFVITRATTCSDMDAFDAMRTLGKIRKSKRADDGFAEMMSRIEKKLLEDDDPEAIDVDFKVVDEPKELPKQEEPKALPEKKKADK